MYEDIDKKEYYIWNDKKIEINDKSLSIDFIFSEREVWWCSLGKNIGSEQNGKNDDFERPVIIFRIFSKDTAWIIPLTSRKTKEGSRKELKIFIKGLTQTADISQLRLISIKRLSRYIDIINYEDFLKIRRYFIDLG